MICIGGCCIPISLFWPLLLLAIKPIYNYLASVFGWKAISENNKSECKDSCCPLSQDKSDCNSSTTAEIKNNEKNCDPHHPLTGHNHIVLNEDDTLDAHVQSRGVGQICFVKFTATWCRPCKEIEPHFLSLVEEYHGSGAHFVTVDVDQCETDAVKYGATAIPLFVALTSAHDKSMKVLGRLNGKDPVRLTSFIKEHASTHAKSN
jgi:thioredoxin 1